LKIAGRAGKNIRRIKAMEPDSKRKRQPLSTGPFVGTIIRPEYCFADTIHESPEILTFPFHLLYKKSGQAPLPAS
jgi:hypothetical protein